MLVRAVKRAWHRDLVSGPQTHAWVLSLYRAGEFHAIMGNRAALARHTNPARIRMLPPQCRNAGRIVRRRLPLVANPRFSRLVTG